MPEIRTQKAKLVGTLDERSENDWLVVREGKITRKIQVPSGGLTVQYIVDGKPPENVFIQPRATRKQSSI